MNLHQAYSRNRRQHRSPRKVLRALREQNAERLTEQLGDFRHQRRIGRALVKAARDPLDDLLPPTHPRGQHRQVSS